MRILRSITLETGANELMSNEGNPFNTSIFLKAPPVGSEGLEREVTMGWIL